MKSIHKNARKMLEETREAMKQYHNCKATPQPDIDVGDLVMVKAKNIGTKRPSQKLSPKLYSPSNVLEKRGNQADKLNISVR
jgi:hypothetical protein